MENDYPEASAKINDLVDKIQKFTSLQSYYLSGLFLTIHDQSIFGFPLSL